MKKQAIDVLLILKLLADLPYTLQLTGPLSHPLRLAFRVLSQGEHSCASFVSIAWYFGGKAPADTWARTKVFLPNQVRTMTALMRY